MGTTYSLQTYIASFNPGHVFCINDLSHMGTRTNTDVTLHRLTQKGLVRRLGHGLYDIPMQSPLLGTLNPKLDDILKAYARRLGHLFVPDPQTAANMLGLTTQVPAKVVYLSSGRSHTLTIFGIDIHFVHAAPKKIAGASSSVGVIIQALRFIHTSPEKDKLIDRLSQRLTPQDVASLQSLKGKTLGFVSTYIERLSQRDTLH